MEAMGELLPYRPPKAREETTAYLGMVVFLGSWAMMFAALFFAYGFVRSRSAAWPPPDVPELPWGAPAINTLVLAGSSVASSLDCASFERARPASWAARYSSRWRWEPSFLLFKQHFGSAFIPRGSAPRRAGLTARFFGA